MQIPIPGTAPGSRLTNFDQAGKGGRLTASSLYRLPRSLGDQLGLSARPHGLRHAAIPQALELTGGDVRGVERFRRPRDVRIVQRCDDNRTELAGEVARQVAA